MDNDKASSLIAQALSFEDAELVTEVLVEAIEGAERSLELHLNEPPLEETTTGDAAETYANLIAIASRRVMDLKRLHQLFDGSMTHPTE